MMTFYRRITITCLLILTSNLSFAEDWYQIEVIAFEYKHPNQDEVELWESHPGEPDWKTGINLMDEATARARRKQQEPVAAAPAPLPPQAKAETPPTETDVVDNGDAPQAAPAPAPAPAAPSTDVPGEKFVTVEDILSGQTNQVATAAPSTPSPNDPLAFVSLPPSQFSLGSVVNKLENKNSYRILSHRAWRQPAFTGNSAQAVHIAGGALLDHDGVNSAARYEFEALVSLRSSKYLHLDVDALLREPNSSKNLGGKFNTPADLGLLETKDKNNEKMPVYQEYRLDQSQRVRSNKVYYYDHPLMGLIIKISPYGG
jgi:hypothetical protein